MRSATRHRDLSARKARRVTRDEFPAFSSEPAFEGYRPRAGESVERYLHASAARVADRAGHRSIVESTYPLRGRTPAGRAAPIDLALQPHGTGFTPVSAAVRSRFPGRIASGIEMALEDDAGLVVRPVKARGAKAARLGSGKVMYANTDVDTDTLAAAMPFGVELFTQIRSIDSPEVHAFDVELPDGVAVRKSGRGAEIARGRDRLGFVNPPLAWDADNRRVAVRLSVTRDRLRLVVRHRSADVAYPVMVDPLIENFQHWRTDPNVDWLYWWFDTPSGFSWSREGAWGRGAYLVTTGTDYPHTWSSYSRFAAPGDAYVYAAEFNLLRHQPPSGGPMCVSAGIYSGAVNDYESPVWTRCGGFWDESFGTCVNGGGAYPDCNEGAGSPPNEMRLQYWAFGAGPRGPFGVANMGGALVKISDRNAPSVRHDSPPSGWASSHQLSVSARDTGLGLRRIGVTSPTAPAWSGAERTWNCDGSRFARYENRCSSSWETLGYSADGLPEGAQTVRATAEDGLPRTSPASDTTVKIDRTAPDYEPGSPSGPLAPTSGWVGHPSPSLTVDVRDPSPSGGQVSGVRYSKIEFDRPGGPSDTKDNDKADGSAPPCDAQSGCRSTLQHTLGWNDVSDGTHDVRVSTEDAAGHPAQRTWTVKVDRTKPTLDVTWEPDISFRRLWEDEYVATLSATDASSGVQRAELLVDGQRLRDEHLFERSSACDGCPLNHTFTLRTADLTPGPHTITITTRDFAGNDSPPQSWPVTFEPGAGQRDHFGFDTFAGDEALTVKVNRASGNLLVESHDVRDVEMPIDRYYNSSWAGRRGMFGRGWSASAGPDVRLREAADGSVVFFGPSQYAARFARNPDGTYAPPVHFSGTLTRRPDGVYVVHDRVRGDMFEFPSSNGRLEAITDEAEDRVDVNYMDDGRIDGLSDIDDRITTFAPGESGVASITDPDREVGHSYSYDGNNLVSSTNSADATTSYEYDAMEQLSGLSLPNGVRIAIVYDEEGRVATVTRFAPNATVGEVSTYMYSEGQTTVTRPTGVAVYRHDANLQVYTPDSTPPEVYEPFGQSPEGPATDGEHVGGAATAEIPVIVDDIESGVQRVWLERIGSGTIAERTTSCSSLPGGAGFVSVCPPRYESTIAVDTSGLPEGANTFRLSATDGAGNTGTYPTFDLLVDRTAPPAPSDLRISEFDPDTGQADVSWDLSGDDPDLPTGHAGSGVGTIEYRYRVGSGSFTAWTVGTDPEDAITLTGLAEGDQVTVEARVADGVGNVSATASATLTVAVPQAESDEFGVLPSGSSAIEMTTEIEVEGETPADTVTYPGATMRVSVTHQATGQEAVRLADTAGVARFPDLAPGTYTISPVDSEMQPRSVTVGANETKQEQSKVTLTSAQYGGATPAEEKVCDQIGLKCASFYFDALWAARQAGYNFTEPEEGSEGTKTNGFKHPFWVAMMVRSQATLSYPRDEWRDALRLATAHESRSRKGDLKDRRNSKMDFRNNRLGFRTGMRHFKHNDEWFCNHMRHRTRAGVLRKQRRGSTRWRRRPPRYKIAWIRVFHKDTGNKPRLRYPTRCGLDNPDD